MGCHEGETCRGSLRSELAPSPRPRAAARHCWFRRCLRQPALPAGGRQRDRLSGRRASVVRREQPERAQPGTNPAVTLAARGRAKQRAPRTRRPVQLAPCERVRHLRLRREDAQRGIAGGRGLARGRHAPAGDVSTRGLARDRPVRDDRERVLRRKGRQGIGHVSRHGRLVTSLVQAASVKRRRRDRTDRMAHRARL